MGDPLSAEQEKIKKLRLRTADFLEGKREEIEEKTSK